MMVPFPPGGATTSSGALVAAKMQEVWASGGKSRNKPGAGTVVGTEYVAKAAPDGYTLGFVVTAYVINPSLRSDLPYDTLRDLTGVTQVSVQHLVMARILDFPRTTSGADRAREEGAGQAGLRDAWERHRDAPLGRAPEDQHWHRYRPRALQGRRAGAAGRDGRARADPHGRALRGAAADQSGRIKVLALLSPKRDPDAPEYPVVAESVPGVSALSLVGIVAPAATPKELVHRIGADIARAVKSSDLTERMKQQGMEPIGSTPEQFDTVIRSEIEKWAKVVKVSGAKVD